MTVTEMLLEGVCPDCNSQMKAWSLAEIKAAKDEIGMEDDDEFFDCCEACANKYMP